jgi:hypothetical protein
MNVFLKKIVMTAGILLFAGMCFAAEPESNGNRWKVIVSIADQKTYVYDNEKLVRAAVCSTGIEDGDNDTPLGDYILNESGQKRGEFFYSRKVGEGARCWVGFIGGVYLFHSVPVTEDNAVIPEEAAKLGEPASHGCVRLSMRNAYWFYRTVPDGASVHIQKEPYTCSTDKLASPLVSKKQVTSWLSFHEHEYYQQHLLSCEAALVRLTLAITGIRDLDEDTILYSFPWGTDPEKSFVCDNVDAGRRNKDGSIHWNNYGTHPPLVVKTLQSYLHMYGLDASYEVREMKLSDADLRNLAANNERFLGAVVWLVGHPERWGEHPPVKNGIVLGEHVRFVDPELDKAGKFMVWDPEKHPDQPYHLAAIPTRNMFGYRTVALFKR